MAECNWEPVPVLPGQDMIPRVDLPTQDRVISMLGREGWEFGDVTLAVKAVCGAPLDLTATVTDHQLAHIRYTLSAVWRAPNTKGGSQHGHR